MITVFVGSADEYLSIKAKGRDSNAKLITDKNFNNLEKGTYYTSIEDLISLPNLAAVLIQADEIVYCPLDNWDNADAKKWTEIYLTYYKNIKNISGIDHLIDIEKDLQGILELKDLRKTDSKQIWVAGCSFSHGVGIDDNQRYGQLIANELNLPVSFLTAPGSSISWAADQLLRSDIRENDIVIWGLTKIERLPYYTNKIIHVNAKYYEYDPGLDLVFSLDLLDSNHSVYMAITSIHQVINFCNKVNARLTIAELIVNKIKLNKFFTIANSIELFHRFSKTSEYIDLGSDGAHPGPKHHKWYADQILKTLKNDITR